MRRIFASMLILLSVVGCRREEAPAGGPAAAVDTATTTQPSLYDRLGGINAITTVVDSFIGRASKDTRINKKFARSDVTRLRFLLIQQVCNVTGGPCDYTGQDMPTAHRNMGVTDGEFDALVEDLTGVLDKLNVPAAEKNELLGLLAPLRSQIVSTPGTATGTPLPAAFQPAPPLDSAKLKAGPARQ